MRIAIWTTQNDPERMQAQVNAWLAVQGDHIRVLDTQLVASGRMDVNVTVLITYDILETSPWEGTPP